MLVFESSSNKVSSKWSPSFSNESSRASGARGSRASPCSEGAGVEGDAHQEVTKLTGPTTHQEASVWDLERTIRDAGFVPVERDTLYRPVERPVEEARRTAPAADERTGGL